MSISIYFEARRPTPLTAEEEKAIRAVESRYSVAKQVEKYLTSGSGLNWEDFSRLRSEEEGALFWGAIKLPDNSEDATWTGVRHWAAALAEIRNALPGTTWHVHVDDHDLQWNEQAQNYDLSR